MAPSKAQNAGLFEKIINDGRERRQSQNLAESILLSKRNGNGSSRRLSSGLGGTMASRIGSHSTSSLNTSSKSSANRAFSSSTAHTLSSASKARGAAHAPKTTSLASRISAPEARGLATVGAPRSNHPAPKHKKSKPGLANTRIAKNMATATGPKGAKLQTASIVNDSPSSFYTLSTHAEKPAPAPAAKARKAKKPAAATASSTAATTATTAKPPSPPIQQSAPPPAMHDAVAAPLSSKARGRESGLSIRGLAGPYAVLAQNFAPGTTAADIESAMSVVGGEMLSCEIVLTTPFILAEMVFATREGGERVVARFNNQTADGRIIKVFPKPGGYVSPNRDADADLDMHPRRAPPVILDGSHGFPDGSPAVGQFHAPAAGMPSDGSAGGGLYSDEVVAGVRRGRGFRSGWAAY
ncbi:hypothetical protein BROUX41_003851 [Berkeleyomyces rouxiae]|uniref:uncharacterized protein n=1 Tax=Berkeleyomyces rouxiae TaxID=2035830 RepID=UPI003B78CA33